MTVKAGAMLLATILVVLLVGCAGAGSQVKALEASEGIERDAAALPLGRPEEIAENGTFDNALTPIFNGKDLAGWKITEEADFKRGGKVYVKDGTIVLEEGDPMTGITWAGDFPKTDYEVSLEAMRVTGYDFFCGITFPVGESWCTLIVGGWGGMIVGLSNVDGMNAADNLTTQGTTFESGQWYPIRLRVTQEEIDVWIDGEREIHLPREGHEFDIWWEQEPATPFGINTWETGAALRNLNLRRLPHR